jgi:hypothetical protein
MNMLTFFEVTTMYFKLTQLCRVITNLSVVGIAHNSFQKNKLEHSGRPVSMQNEEGASALLSV